MSFIAPNFLEQVMLDVTICSSIWSLFIYVTKIKFRFYQSVILIALQVLLSLVLVPYLGVTIVTTLFYLAIISYKMSDSPMVENLFFALYPPILFSILWNFMARIVCPLIFNHSYTYLTGDFVWKMVVMISVILVERFLREFYQTDYVALKNSIWLDSNTKRNFFVVYLEMLSYFVLQHLLDILTDFHISQIVTVPLTTLYIVVAVIYFLIFMKILILIDYYSQNYMKDLREREQQHYLENLEQYSQQIEELYSSVRSFKHDYNNILLSLKGSIDSNDIEQVTEVFDEMFRDNIVGLDNKDLQGQLVNVLVPEVRTYLYVKMNALEQQGIHLVLDIPNLIVDCGVTSSAGVMVLDEMFNRLQPILAAKPRSIVTIRVTSTDKVQYYRIEVSPCQLEVYENIPDISVEIRKMLNHYKAFSFEQSLEGDIFVQTLAVEVRREAQK